MEIIETGAVIGPTFGAELATAGLSAVEVGWRSDGVFSFSDNATPSEIADVLVVVAAHVANPTPYAEDYITALGGDPATESVPALLGSISALEPATGAQIAAGLVAVTAVGNIPASTTRYLCFSGSELAFQAITGDAQQRAMTDRVLYALWVFIEIAQPASGSLVVTVRRNASATALALTIPAGSPAGLYQAATATPVVITGAPMLDVEYVNNATAASADISGHEISFARTALP